MADRAVRLNKAEEWLLAHLEEHIARDGPGSIYVIESGGRHKIGKTRGRERRLLGYKTHSPFPTTVVLCQEAAYYGLAERMLLRRHRGTKVHGEWHELSAEDIDDIRGFLDLFNQRTAQLVLASSVADF